jgi:hypothetical protein
MANETAKKITYDHLLETLCKKTAYLKKLGVPEDEAKAIVKAIMNEAADIVAGKAIVIELPITETRPEKMRVRRAAAKIWTVEAFSHVVKKWIVQAEHLSEKAAVNDCRNWYK